MSKIVGDENLRLQRENGTEHDQFTVALLFQELTVVQVPKDLSKLFHRYLCLPHCIM